jgi:hypothetical protein
VLIESEEPICWDIMKWCESCESLGVVNSEEGKYSSCVSNEIFKEGGCSVIKNRQICEDANVLFDIENRCSWIKDSKEEEYCIDSNRSPKCSYYTTYNGCSWIKAGDVAFNFLTNISNMNSFKFNPKNKQSVALSSSKNWPLVKHIYSLYEYAYGFVCYML